MSALWTSRPNDVEGWQLVDKRVRSGLFSSQGLATIHSAGQSKLIYRGDLSIPRKLRDSGWVHIGDPGSLRDLVFDAYQGESTANSKMFTVTRRSARLCKPAEPMRAGRNSDLQIPGHQIAIAWGGIHL